MAQQPIYLNNVEIGPGPISYPHLDQPRQFKGKGDPRYDCTVIISSQDGQALNTRVYEWARDWFTAEDWASPNFRWPAQPLTEKDGTSFKLFPGAYKVKVSRKADKGAPAKKMVDGTPVNMPGRFKPGNTVMVAADFQTYRESSQQLGIAAYAGEIAWIGEGSPFSEAGAGASLNTDALQRAAASTVLQPAVDPAQLGVAAQPETPTPVQPAAAPPPMPGPPPAAAPSPATSVITIIDVVLFTLFDGTDIDLVALTT